jgi:hypothetical protein
MLTSQGKTAFLTVIAIKKDWLLLLLHFPEKS